MFGAFTILLFGMADMPVEIQLDDRITAMNDFQKSTILHTLSKTHPALTMDPWNIHVQTSRSWVINREAARRVAPVKSRAGPWTVWIIFKGSDGMAGALINDCIYWIYDVSCDQER